MGRENVCDSQLSPPRVPKTAPGALFGSPMGFKHPLPVTSLLQYLVFVELDSMRPEQREQLVGEILLLMVAFLSPNVLRHHLNLRLTHREHPVPVLPGERLHFWMSPVHP